MEAQGGRMTRPLLCTDTVVTYVPDAELKSSSYWLVAPSFGAAQSAVAWLWLTRLLLTTVAHAGCQTDQVA